MENIREEDERNNDISECRGSGAGKIFTNVKEGLEAHFQKSTSQ